MPTPGQFRTYTWVLRLPVAMATPKCNEFHDFLREQISQGRKLLEFRSFPEDPKNCIIRIRIQCWSCGQSGPNRLRRNILIEFPEVDAKELHRERN